MERRGECLREKQKKLVLDLFDTVGEERERERGGGSGVPTVWKVLVFDEKASDVIAQVARKEDLREKGVTLFLPLRSSRQKIPDAPAVYIVAPTKANIEAISRDCAARLYSGFHIHFLSKLPDDLMRLLAENAVRQKFASVIEKVYDDYVDFVCLADSLVSLNMPNSYLNFNDFTLSEGSIQEKITEVVQGLFSVIVTWQEIPIIRAPPNTLASMIAEELNEILRAHLMRTDSLLSSTQSSPTRPVLLLLDRNTDLTPMLQHPWTYQPLVHDLMRMKKNRVRFQLDGEEGAPPEQKTYDLDNDDDFWVANAANPFTDVVVEIQERVTEYRKAREEVMAMKLSDPNGEVEVPGTSALVGKTKDLGSFMNRMPELTQKKKVLDMHTNIATALMKGINERNIAKLFEVEQQLILRGYSSSAASEVQRLLTDKEENCGSFVDKLRLYLIYFLTNHELEKAEEEELESILKAFRDIEASQDPPEEGFSAAIFGSGKKTSAPYVPDLACLGHFKKMKKFANPMSSAAASSGVYALNSNSSVPTSSSRFASITSFGTGILGTGIRDILSAGVSYVQTSSKNLHVTQLVDAVVFHKKNSQVSTFLSLDPKQTNKNGASASRTTPYSECLVFIVGGGNYVEYENIVHYGKESGRRIIYGTTEMLSPEDFLKQVEVIGKKMT